MEIGVKQLRSRTREVLERVARGENVTILRRGKRAAQIVALPQVGAAGLLPKQTEFRARIRVRGEPLSQAVLSDRAATPR